MARATTWCGSTRVCRRIIQSSSEETLDAIYILDVSTFKIIEKHYGK